MVHATMLYLWELTSQLWQRATGKVRMGTRWQYSVVEGSCLLKDTEFSLSAITSFMKGKMQARKALNNEGLLKRQVNF